VKTYPIFWVGVLRQDSGRHVFCGRPSGRKTVRPTSIGTLWRIGVSTMAESCSGRFCIWARSIPYKSRRGGRRSALFPEDRCAVQHHPGQPEARSELGDLGRQCHRVGGIALKHFDRHRAAIGRAQQAVDNQTIRSLPFGVTRVAKTRQLAAPAFEPGR
jgi:hypothetical protein